MVQLARRHREIDPDSTLTDSERSQRRGFAEAAEFALAACLVGATIDDLERWAEDVFAWELGEEPGVPPLPDVKVRAETK